MIEPPLCLIKFDSCGSIKYIDSSRLLMAIFSPVNYLSRWRFVSGPNSGDKQ